MKLDKKLSKEYNEQYTDKTVIWRKLGAEYKVKRMSKVCNGKVFNKVLDVGAGDGSIIQFLGKHKNFKKFYAVEISDSAIKFLRKNKEIKRLEEVKKFDGYKIPYKDKEFDLVVLSHVLEHVEHPRMLLREIKRVSKYFCIEIPLDYSINVDKQLEHFLSYGHINIFTPSLIRFLLQSEGFVRVGELLSNDSEEFVKRRREMNKEKSESFIQLYKKLKSKLVMNIKSKKFREEYGYYYFTGLYKSSNKDLEVFK